MPNKVAVVVMSKYPDIFAKVDATIRQWLAGVRKILVRDGSLIGPVGDDWQVIQGPAKFNYAANANLGWQAVKGWDILHLNDDVTLLGPTIEGFQTITEDPTVGIVSPLFVPGNVGTATQQGRFGGLLIEEPDHFAFACVFIPASTIARVGYMDEQFSEYGGDDVDYSWQVREAGLRLVATKEVKVHHGFGAFEHSATARRSESTDNRIGPQVHRMHALLKAKWGRSV